MKELLDIIGAVFERSGFFFVPILSIMALFDLSALTGGRVRKSFLLLAAIPMFGYMLAGNGSSRYLLIPLLSVGMLAGAGATAPLKYLHFIKPLRWLNTRHLLIFFTALTVICSFIKLALSEHPAALSSFDGKTGKSDNEVLFFSVNNSHGIRIAGKALSDRKNIQFLEFRNWRSAMQQLMTVQHGSADIFFFTAIPDEYTPEDLLKWIRGKYYLAPFEVVHSARNRSRCFILLKFNGRILDGEQKFLRTNALAALPENLLMQDYRNWGVCPVTEYLPSDIPIIYEPEIGTFVSSQVFFRKSADALPRSSKLQLRNSLYWLEAERVFNLSINAPPPEAVTWVAVNAKVSNADAVPLITPAEKIFIANEQQFIHLSGVNALWRPGSRRLQFLPPGEKHPAVPGRFDFTVQDTILNTSASSSLIVIKEDLRDLHKLQGSILLLQDSYGTRLQLPENLRTKLPPQVNIHTISLPTSTAPVLSDALDTPLPQGDFQVILLNIFSDAFARNWTIPLEIDPFMDEYLTKLSERLEQHYPRAVAVLLLPPPPPPGDTMYALNNSSYSSRLAHYHTISAVQRWQQRTGRKNVEILPLYFSIDPGRGYLFDYKIPSAYSGYMFSSHAQNVMAENTAAFFIHLYKNRGSFR